jgi:prepilin-type N-terminal cleavage/methylation domain-containing protein
MRPAPDRGALRSPRRRLLCERGYTMTELLVVMIILGVIVTSLATVFVSASRAEADQNLRFRAQQEARLALDQLRREGHCANALAPATPTSSLTFTFGPHCNRAIDLGARARFPAAVNTTQTSFTIAMLTGAFPTPPFNIRVNTEIMRVTGVSGTTWTVQRAQLGTTAGAHAVNSIAQPGPYQVTWCTSGSGTRFALRRILDVPGSCAGGKVVADHLTGGNVFGFMEQSPTRRATLTVSFVVRIDTSSVVRTYRLRDDIVLRNTNRVTP